MGCLPVLVISNHVFLVPEIGCQNGQEGGGGWETGTGGGEGGWGGVGRKALKHGGSADQGRSANRGGQCALYRLGEGLQLSKPEIIPTCGRGDECKEKYRVVVRGGREEWRGSLWGVGGVVGRSGGGGGGVKGGGPCAQLPTLQSNPPPHPRKSACNI